MAEIGTDIEKARAILEAGELVAIPTETVYGLAANALDGNAVAKIFSAKDRPAFDPLIIHVPDLDSVDLYVEAIPVKARRLASLFWPGPLTLVLKKRSIVPDIVTSGMDTVGVRCPDHHMTRDLLQSLSFPLAAPSANPFGYVSPTEPKHVAAQLGDRIDYILDGGECKVGIESTIIGFENEQPVIYRLGGLSLEKIESVVGLVEISLNSSSDPKAPGQLKSHYSPRKRVVIGKMDELLQKYSAYTSGILSFSKDYSSTNQIILSRDGNLEEAAKNLFKALRSFDDMNVEIVLAEEVPQTGIGRAINDRLRRAAASDPE